MRSAISFFSYSRLPYQAQIKVKKAKAKSSRFWMAIAWCLDNHLEGIAARVLRHKGVPRWLTKILLTYAAIVMERALDTPERTAAAVHWMIRHGVVRETCEELVRQRLWKTLQCLIAGHGAMSFPRHIGLTALAAIPEDAQATLHGVSIALLERLERWAGTQNLSIAAYSTWADAEALYVQALTRITDRHLLQKLACTTTRLAPLPA